MKKICILLSLYIISTMTATAALKIGFELNFPNPQTHYTQVKMRIDDVSKDFIDIKMPVWAPGSYLIREFAKSVEGFSASADHKPLQFEKTDKNTWRIWTQHQKNIEIDYLVYAFEVSVRTSFIDQNHAFISPSGVFMYVDGQLKSSSTVKVNLPSAWKSISTGLPAVKGENNTYYASDFDILFDSPLEIGNQDILTFEAAGVQHQVAMYNPAPASYDAQKLTAGMAKIVEQESLFFGENPNKDYTFIVHNLSYGSGGLEHLNACTLGVKREDYATDEGFKGFLELVAHEYFHLWNVKRLRPVALGPFNYNQENYTTSLWIAEGFTSYFENKFMIRAGFYTPDEFIKNYVNTLGTVINTPGTKVQSISESSFDAWIKGYRPNENSLNTGISYYNKGPMVAMMMDLEIINATKGQKSLDDVMKLAYQNFYKKRNQGYTETEFKQLVEQVSGENFDEFYQKYVFGTADMDYNKYLAYAGYSLSNIAPANSPTLGILASNINGKAVARTIMRNSAAWDGGLNVNDVLLSIDGKEVNSLQIDSFMGDKKVGDTLTVKVLRDGLEKSISLSPKADTKVRFSINSQADKTQTQVRNKWMMGK